MKPLCSFFGKFASVIAWVLSCFDRIIFKGHLPISRVAEFERFVDYVLKIRRVDFLKNVGPAWSECLVEYSKGLAEGEGRPWRYYPGEIDKDGWAKEQLVRSPIQEGLVGVLCVMEACPTFKLAPGQDRPGFVSRKVPQRVLYYYFVDKELGLIHVRLQTWAPFTCQVYANGHDYVARQLKKKGLAFEQVDNAFVRLEDPAAAQRSADRFAKLPWPRILEEYARQVNPLLQDELKGLSHYWVIDQAEYATDVRFASKRALAGLFARLLTFALLTFSPKKIFCYLGRKWHERFDGEVQTHYKSVREPGACIKHFMKRNWLKMYDKLGLLVRVETVINQPGEFKVLRDRRRGIVAVLAAVMLTVVVGIAAIGLDGGLLQDNKRRVQATADAAAMAGATSLFRSYPTIVSTGVADPSGSANADALASASTNGFPNNGTTSSVAVYIPPTSGPFKGKTGYVEVIVTYNQPRYFSAIWSGGTIPVVARAVALGRWGGTGNGVIILDPAAKDSLDASGSGTVTATGGANMIVDSNHSEAARVTGGSSALTAPKFDITGGTTGSFNGTVNTGVLPTPDPLAYLPAPAKPAAGTMTTTHKSGAKQYFLTPGSYNNLPNFGNGDTVTLQQGGMYYIDGGGLTSTGGASILMDSKTSGGVMIYNAPSGAQSSQGINISGGTITLSPMTSGLYAGIIFWQDRTSSVSMSIQGQGGFTIGGTFYAANALLSVSGQGNNTIGSQFISRTLNMSGGGATVINYTDDSTARLRDIRLVE